MVLRKKLTVQKNESEVAISSNWEFKFSIAQWHSCSVDNKVFESHLFLGILNNKFSEIKHNEDLLKKHLEFICVKSKYRHVEDSASKMITHLLDLIKFYRTPDSS